MSGLEPVAPVAAGEADRRERHPLGEGEHLEELAHLVLVDELDRIAARCRADVGEQLADQVRDGRHRGWPRRWEISTAKRRCPAGLPPARRRQCKEAIGAAILTASG